MPKETISIRVDEDMKQAIVAWASRQPIEMDRSGVVRYALRRLLEESGDLVQKAKRSRVKKIDVPVADGGDHDETSGEAHA